MPYRGLAIVVLCCGAVSSQAAPDWSMRSITGTSGHAMAYDAARERVVRFGGFGEGSRPCTWEWDGIRWTAREPETSPPARCLHGMAYDGARRRVVLFGGFDLPSRRELGDTWEWDGSTWKQLAPKVRPPPRVYSGMCYDADRKVAVLHGGSLLTRTLFSDTWEWDGVIWVPKFTPNVPQPRIYPALVHDPRNHCVVMFGGQHERASNEVWELSDTPARSRSSGLTCPTQGGPQITSTSPFLGTTSLVIGIRGARPSTSCVVGLSLATQAVPIGNCTLYLKDPIVPHLLATNPFGSADTTPWSLPLEPSLRAVTLHAQGFVADPSGPVLGLTFTSGLDLVLGH